MGLAPMRHPRAARCSPGPSRASSGAQNRMDARIRPAASGARSVRMGCPCTASAAPCQPAAAHAPQQGKTILHVGQARHILQPHRPAAQQRSCQQRSSAPFLAAGTSTLPCKGRPPVMIQSPAMSRPLLCKRYPMVCKTRVFGQRNALKRFPLSAGFVRSFVRFFRLSCTDISPFQAGNAGLYQLSPWETESTMPISPRSIIRLVPPEEKKGRLMPVFGMVLVTTAIFSTACSATCTTKPTHQQCPEAALPRVRRQRDAPPQQRTEQQNDRTRAQKAQFLAEDGKDEVVLRLGHEQMF